MPLSITLCTITSRPLGGQRRILVAVHLVSPWNTEASQPQLPRFGPDGQPPERPHLAPTRPDIPDALSRRARPREPTGRAPPPLACLQIASRVAMMGLMIRESH